jgi:predicted extracellular nuclease
MLPPVQRRLTQILCGIMSAILFVVAPSSALADGVTTNNVALPPVLITEFQTGSSASGKDEFIELYNDSANTVDITGWQVRYMSATSTAALLSAPTQTVIVAAQPDGSETQLPASSYFVLRTQTVPLPTDAFGQTYAYTLPASGGSIALTAFDASTCTFTEDDAVAWGAGSSGQGSPIPATTKDSSSEITVPQPITIPDTACSLPGSGTSGDTPTGDQTGLQDPGANDVPPTATEASASDQSDDAAAV